MYCGNVNGTRQPNKRRDRKRESNTNLTVVPSRK